MITPLIAFLLVMLTDRSGLATSVNTLMYDEVKVVVFNEVSTVRSPIFGSSYPPRKDYPKLCEINIYSAGTSSNLGDCPDTELPEFENCTVVYYEEESCSTDLIQLVKQVKERGGRAVIYRTKRRTDEYYLNQLAMNTPGIAVILVKDEDHLIRAFGNEPVRYVNITLIGQTEPSTPSNPKDGLANRSTTTFYFVVFAFTILLLLSLTWFIFNYLRRCHNMYTTKRRRVRNLCTCGVYTFGTAVLIGDEVS